MEYKNLSPEAQTGQLNILKFKAANGFIIVLRLNSLEDLVVKKERSGVCRH